MQRVLTAGHIGRRMTEAAVSSPEERHRLRAQASDSDTRPRYQWPRLLRRRDRAVYLSFSPGRVIPLLIFLSLDGLQGFEPE